MKHFTSVCEIRLSPGGVGNIYDCAAEAVKLARELNASFGLNAEITFEFNGVPLLVTEDTDPDSALAKWNELAVQRYHAAQRERAAREADREQEGMQP